MVSEPSTTATDESTDASVRTAGEPVELAGGESAEPAPGAIDDSTGDGTDTPATASARRLAAAGLIGAAVAVALNALARVVALSALGVPAGFEPLGWAPVINTTVAGAVGATVVYGALGRVSARPDRAFVGLSAAVLALSFAPLIRPPSFLADAPAAVLATLGVMHVTTAVVVVAALLAHSRLERE